MAEIRPFKGIRYNANKVSNMAGVIVRLTILSARSFRIGCIRPRINFVRIEYNLEPPSDNDKIVVIPAHPVISHNGCKRVSAGR